MIHLIPRVVSCSLLIALVLSANPALAADATARPAPGPLAPGVPVRGWTILSSSDPDDLAVIAASPAYAINHLQLSHQIVDDLSQLKNDAKRDKVNRLIDAAHTAGIAEVVAWDHQLYNLDYYPAEFRTGPGSTLDFDNPKFWEWFKSDYRAMLDRAPHLDGVVLTFIETGARAERQSSRNFATNQAKIAAVVDAVADVVITERHLNLYARTFSYSDAEYRNVIGAIDLVKNKGLRLMMKETPHDFFLTHPNDKYAGTIDRPTLMEFDAAGEFNGQGVVANTWPEYILRRWRDFATRPHIIGYTARVDRFGDTRLVGKPGEINLLALKMGADDPQVTAEAVHDRFIAEHYGKAAKADGNVKAAFKNALEIATSSLYTLGTNVANHSALDFDTYSSSYIRHVSGKWMDPPIGYVAHGVDREFHYWSDVVDHIAPASVKGRGTGDAAGGQWNEVPQVKEHQWVHPGEMMNAEYLRYIVTEKNYGVALAEQSLKFIDAAKPTLTPAVYTDLHNYFERTLLSAKLRRAAATALYAHRIAARGPDFQTPFVKKSLDDALSEIQTTAEQVKQVPTYPRGQWDWKKDADTALKYAQTIKSAK